jgi:Zinc finger, C2H2 type
MAEECADCGATFGSPAELVAHMKKAHAGGDPKASMEMNPESHIPGLECAACGARFATREALASHNLRPHTTTKSVKTRAMAST